MKMTIKCTVVVIIKLRYVTSKISASADQATRWYKSNLLVGDLNEIPDVEHRLPNGNN